MEEKDWKEFDKLYAKWEKARDAYHRAHQNLRGVFSEMARSYDKNTVDHNRLYEEEHAHEEFNRARKNLHEFLNRKLKKD